MAERFDTNFRGVGRSMYGEPTTPTYQSAKPIPLQKKPGFWTGIGQIMYGSTVPGGQAFLISGLVTLGGSILSAMFGKKQEPSRSSKDIYFGKMVKFYGDLGRRSKSLQSIHRAVTGKRSPALDFNFDNAWDNNGVPDSIYEEDV